MRRGVRGTLLISFCLPPARPGLWVWWRGRGPLRPSVRTTESPRGGARWAGEFVPVGHLVHRVGHERVSGAERVWVSQRFVKALARRKRVRGERLCARAWGVAYKHIYTYRCIYLTVAT